MLELRAFGKPAIPRYPNENKNNPEDVATFRAILSDHGNRERNPEENPLLKWWGALVSSPMSLVMSRSVSEPKYDKQPIKKTAVVGAKN